MYLSRRAATVDLPPPELPTKATTLPAGRVKLKLFRTFCNLEKKNYKKQIFLRFLKDEYLFRASWVTKIYIAELNLAH